MEQTIRLLMNSKTSRMRNSFDSPEIDFFVGQIGYTHYDEIPVPQGYEIVFVNHEELTQIQKSFIAKRNAKGEWVEGATKKEQETILESRKAGMPDIRGSNSTVEDQITQLQLAVVDLMSEVERLGGSAKTVPITDIQAELVIKEELSIADIPKETQSLVRETVEELLL